ncbi:MAG: hypothetical protein WD847_10775 [Pirellulales bacterium]
MAQVRIDSSSLKIGLLLLAHFAAGLVLCRPAWTYLWPDLLSIWYAGLIYAQATLVGAWGALGTTEPWSRTLAVLVTMAYLSLLAAVSFGGPLWLEVWPGSFVLCSLPPAVIFIALSVVKRWQGFAVLQAAASPPNSPGPQFTIRHLFVVTTAVAAILAAGKVVRGFGSSNEIEFFLAAALVVFGLVLTEMAILWATLCAGRPAIRLGIVLPLTLVLGAIHAFYFDKQSDWSYVVWPGLFGFQAAISAASLLVVRSGGWRIVRRARAVEQDAVE